MGKVVKGRNKSMRNRMWRVVGVLFTLSIPSKPLRPNRDNGKGFSKREEIL